MCNHQQTAGMLVITVPLNARLGYAYLAAEETLASVDILLDWSLWDSHFPVTA